MLKMILRIVAGVFALVVILIVCFLLMFTAAKLDVGEVAIGGLPSASPPAGMTISVIPTGSMEARGALAFRGGALNHVLQFTMTAFLIRHPKGDLLIDTGFGKNVDAQIKMLPSIMQTLTTYTNGTSAA